MAWLVHSAVFKILAIITAGERLREAKTQKQERGIEKVHKFVLWQNSYGMPEMRKVWAEENMVQKWLDYEKEIALEMANERMIPNRLKL